MSRFSFSLATRPRVPLSLLLAAALAMAWWDPISPSQAMRAHDAVPSPRDAVDWGVPRGSTR